MIHKPAGYYSVSPYLIVSNGESFIDMMQQIFGAIEKRKFHRDNGKIMHAEIQLDDSIIMFSEVTEHYPPYSLWLHVYFPNVNETFDRAIKYGCELINAPVQKIRRARLSWFFSYVMRPCSQPRHKFITKKL